MRREEPASRLLFVLSVGLIATPVLRDQIEFLTARKVEVHVAASPDPELEDLVSSRGAIFHPWQIERGGGGLVANLRTVRSLVGIAERVEPHVIVAGTPKAGLLGVVIGRMMGIPRVIYTLHGLRLEGSRGPIRLALWITELISCRASHDVHVVGFDLRRRARQLRLLAKDAGTVIRSGGAAGIDTDRFRPGDANSRLPYRAEWEVKHEAKVVGFVGRVTHDKGISELLALGEHWLQRREPHVLVLIGDPDGSHPKDSVLVDRLLRLPNVRWLGRLSKVEEIYPSFDLLLLPSKREGLPTVVLEAAACEVPSVMYACTGASDALVDSLTGVIVPQGDQNRLVAVVDCLLASSELPKMGVVARTRVIQDFAKQDFLPELVDFYLRGASPESRLLPKGT